MDADRFDTLAHSVIATRLQRGPLHRIRTVAPMLALLTALLLAGPALSAVKIGTNGNDTLIGTAENDKITGNGGDDSLKGKAGNDTYFFADIWGTDTLVEKAGEGIDTVDFHAVKTGPVSVHLVPSWVPVDPDFNAASGPNGEVGLAYQVNGAVVQSIVENAIGGQGDGDAIEGGDGKNVLQPGGGAADALLDVGGRDDGTGGFPDIPASNDVYKGFATNTGTDLIEDFGGNGDVLDLRPYATGDVFATAIDLDGDATTFESLQIVTGLTGQIIIFGQFGDVDEITDVNNLHGHIETIRFADKTFGTTNSLQSATVASTEALSGKQARLAEVAEGLAEEARALFDPNDPLGLLRISGDRRSPSGADTSGTEKQDRNGHHRKPKH